MRADRCGGNGSIGKGVERRSVGITRGTQSEKVSVTILII